MTLMTIDADYVCEFSSHIFVLVGKSYQCDMGSSKTDSVLDAPIQILIATIFLYNLLGICLFTPFDCKIDHLFFQAFLASSDLP